MDDLRSFGFTSVGIEAITILAEFLRSPREKSILRSKEAHNSQGIATQKSKENRFVVIFICCELFIVAARLPLKALQGTKIPGFWPEIENSTFFMIRIGKTIMNILQKKKKPKTGRTPFLLFKRITKNYFVMLLLLIMRRQVSVTSSVTAN